MIFIYRDIKDLDKYFGRIVEVGSIDNRYFREKGLKVFLCSEPVTDVGAAYQELARSEKSRYIRI